MIDLLPCPFCGYPAEIHYYFQSESSGGCRAQCVGVKLHSLDQWDDTEEEAIAAWNTRPSPWRPIAEAKLDETFVDLWSDGERFTNCCFYKGHWFRLLTGGNNVYILVLDPTHFMEIPPAPEDK